MVGWESLFLNIFAGPNCRGFSRPMSLGRRKGRISFTFSFASFSPGLAAGRFRQDDSFPGIFPIPWSSGSLPPLPLGYGIAAIRGLVPNKTRVGIIAGQ